MRCRNFLFLLVAFSLAACAQRPQSAMVSSPAIDAPPTVREGLSPQQLTGILLPADFDMSKGRTLRMRELRIAPGGGLPMHPHADRPAVAYVVSGTVTIYPEAGGAPQVMPAGQAYAAFHQQHAFRNTGTEEAIVIEVDLPAGGA